jgi:hypothetical protein
MEEIFACNGDAEGTISADRCQGRNLADSGTTTAAEWKRRRDEVEIKQTLKVD